MKNIRSDKTVRMCPRGTKIVLGLIIIFAIIILFETKPVQNEERVAFQENVFFKVVEAQNLKVDKEKAIKEEQRVKQLKENKLELIQAKFLSDEERRIKQEEQERLKREAEEEAARIAAEEEAERLRIEAEEQEARVQASMWVGTASDYQAYAWSQFGVYGWTEYDFECLVELWNRESRWNPAAHNSSSGAHGIPQALPAEKMASYGSDYYTNGYTQILWGLDYIAGRYGSPSNALAHSNSHGWY